MASIRNAKGEVFDGPDDAPIPAGYEKVAAPVMSAAPVAASPVPSWADRMLTRGADRTKEIAGFPVRVGKLVAGIDKPQNFEDAALLALGNAPLIAAGGAGAATLAPQIASAAPKLAAMLPALARIVTAGGLAKGRGEDTSTALLESAGAGMAEGAGALAGKVLGQPSVAIDAIKARIGKGTSGPLNVKLFDTLLEWWKADANAAVQSARASRVASQLKDLDPSGEAAKLFREQVVKGAKIPLTHKTLPATSTGFSEAARAVTGNPVVRAGADAAVGALSEEPAVRGLGLMLAEHAPNPFRSAAGMMR